MGTEQKVDYRSTINLPQTGFDMRANLAQKEPERLAKWEVERLYEQREARAAADGLPKYVLHDGPPYANGDIHMGTALNKMLKDFAVRSRAMSGYRAPYVPGWDTHGLPIEHQVVKSGADRNRLDPAAFRALCREYALKYVDQQRAEFKRLGVWGDWEHPYLTLNPDYEAAQIEVFGRMAIRGHIYKGLKPVYWCAECETALAEAEIEYADVASPSIYVKFSVVDGRGVLGDDASLLIWTTTPWTIPANVAIALHPELDYGLVETPAGNVVVALARLDALRAALGWPETPVRARFKGRELEGVKARHPLIDRISLVILGEHVTLEQGTGAVHTAPGHGVEDYEVGQRYELPILSPVDDRGRFTAEAPEYAGRSVWEANPAVIRALTAAGALVGEERIEHSYPHCWRCKNPVIFRATEQWFASVAGFRKAALEQVDAVNWIPEWGHTRIHNMIAERNDWCISRQRIWGVPLPIFYCEACGEALITADSIAAVAKAFRQGGSDVWWSTPAAALLPAGTRCDCGHDGFRKETDIMDVWFDSGSSHAAVLRNREELAWPADLYLEGSDQHRGWFQSSLLTAVATEGAAPYRAVLTHGFIVDGNGNKMSKSIGNTISPADVMKRFGADILRLWASSADYRGDIRLSDEILEQTADAYRKIRNTCRFLLGNLADFAPEAQLPHERLEEIDRWLLDRLARLDERVRRAYERYEYHVVYHAVHNFCAVDLSGFYLDIVRDTLYCDPKESSARRSAQSAMYLTLSALTRLVAPILAFTADEIWEHVPGAEGSVHLQRFTELSSEWRDDALAERWNGLLGIRSLASRAIERARQEKAIRSSAGAEVWLQLDDSAQRTLAAFSPAALRELFLVAAVHPGEPLPAGGWREEEGGNVAVARPTDHARCERCWRHEPEVGALPKHPDLCRRCEAALAKPG